MASFSRYISAKANMAFHIFMLFMVSSTELFNQAVGDDGRRFTNTVSALGQRMGTAISE